MSLQKIHLQELYHVCNQFLYAMEAVMLTPHTNDLNRWCLFIISLRTQCERELKSSLVASWQKYFPVFLMKCYAVLYIPSTFLGYDLSMPVNVPFNGNATFQQFCSFSHANSCPRLELELVSTSQPLRLPGKQLSCKEEPSKKCLGEALPGSSALSFRGLHCSMVSCSQRASSQSLSPKAEHWKNWYWPISLKFMAVVTAQHQQKMGIFECQVQKVLASGSVEDLCQFR